MNTIEFNKKYTKLPTGIKTALLVACEPVRLEAQTSEFIAYDTEYATGTGWGSLDKNNAEPYFDHMNDKIGDYLCLILKSDTGAIFTTLRKDNTENRQKYMGNYIGGGQFEKQRPEFNIIIKED